MRTISVEQTPKRRESTPHGVTGLFRALSSTESLCRAGLSLNAPNLGREGEANGDVVTGLV